MKRLAIIVAIVALFAPAAVAQGSVNASWSENVFTAATGAATSQVFHNFGQGCHWLQVSTNNGIIAATIQLEGSLDNVSYFAISEAVTLGFSSNAVIEAGGYYPDVRARITGLSGIGFVSAKYFASGGICATGGIHAGMKASQPITFIATSGFLNTAVSSTPISVSTGTAIVYGGYVENTTAADVYVIVSDTGQGVTNSNITQKVCANNSTNCPKVINLNLPTIGVGFAGPVTVSCTTSLTVATAPATPCTVNLYYKTGVTAVRGQSGVSGNYFVD